MSPTSWGECPLVELLYLWSKTAHSKVKEGVELAPVVDQRFVGDPHGVGSDVHLGYIHLGSGSRVEPAAGGQWEEIT